MSVVRSQTTYSCVILRLHVIVMTTYMMLFVIDGLSDISTMESLNQTFQMFPFHTINSFRRIALYNRFDISRY